MISMPAEPARKSIKRFMQITGQEGFILIAPDL
jgi:hypothetical protein